MQLYVAFKSFTFNVELVPNDVVLVPFVHLYAVGVVILPFTLKVAVNVAEPSPSFASQLILFGTIVTTASGPVLPWSPLILTHL